MCGTAARGALSPLLESVGGRWSWRWFIKGKHRLEEQQRCVSALVTRHRDFLWIRLSRCFNWKKQDLKSVLIERPPILTLGEGVKSFD